MVMAEVSIVPLGTGTPSVSRYVARAVKILRQEAVAYQLTPMGTVIEGELDTVLGLVRRMHESGFDEEVQRVLTRITIDDRRDKPSSMDNKVRSVQRRLEED